MKLMESRLGHAGLKLSESRLVHAGLKPSESRLLHAGLKLCSVVSERILAYRGE